MDKIKSMLKKFFSLPEGYLRSLIPYILVAVLIFSLGIIFGYFFAKDQPSEAREIISLLAETYKPILEMGKFSQILFIFLKNGATSFIVMVTGIIFGITPVIVLVSNAQFLGILAKFILEENGILPFLLGILPHGVIEIPCFLISCAIGLKIGRTVIRKIFRKGGNLKQEINLGLEVFIRLILICLFLAAIIEVLVSSELLRIY